MNLEKIFLGENMFVIKKKGRPCKYGYSENLLLAKKNNLFESSNSNTQYLNLINLAYHCNKISEKARDIALYLEQLHREVNKNLELKTIPKSAPYTIKSKISYSLNNLSKQDKSTKLWNKISEYVNAYAPHIYIEFFKLLCSHHTYEELMALKTNQQTMNILKQGLKAVETMSDLGYL